MIQLKRSHRILAAISVVWVMLANMLYFDVTKLQYIHCGKEPAWLGIWKMFTFGIDELQPFFIGVSNYSGLSFEQMIEQPCVHSFYFDEIGYAYFLVTPIVILIGTYFLYQWTTKQSSSPTTAE